MTLCEVSCSHSLMNKTWVTCGPALETGQLSMQGDAGNMRPFVTSALLISNNLWVSGGQLRLLTNGVGITTKMLLGSRELILEITWKRYFLLLVSEQKLWLMLKPIRLPWNQILSAKVLEVTYYHPRINTHAFDLSPVFCQKHHSFLCSGEEEGYQITVAMSTVAVTDVLSWNTTSFPPAESHSRFDKDRERREGVTDVLV